MTVNHPDAVQHRKDTEAAVVCIILESQPSEFVLTDGALDSKEELD